MWQSPVISESSLLLFDEKKSLFYFLNFFSKRPFCNSSTFLSESWKAKRTECFYWVIADNVKMRHKGSTAIGSVSVYVCIICSEQEQTWNEEKKCLLTQVLNHSWCGSKCARYLVYSHFSFLQLCRKHVIVTQAEEFGSWSAEPRAVLSFSYNDVKQRHKHDTSFIFYLHIR